MSGETKKCRIKNKHARESIGIAYIVKKLRENRLRWFGHIINKGKPEAVRMVFKRRGRELKKW